MPDTTDTMPLWAYGTRCAILQPDTAADLAETPKAVQVIASGTSKILPSGEIDDAGFVDLGAQAAGYCVPVVVRRIHADTSATLLAIYD